MGSFGSWERKSRLPMDKLKVAVIGSGFGGLAVAIRLQAAGFDVVIFEKRDQPGGRAYVYRDQGFIFDAGPTVPGDRPSGTISAPVIEVLAILRFLRSLHGVAVIAAHIIRYIILFNMAVLR